MLRLLLLIAAVFAILLVARLVRGIPKR